MNWHYIHDKLRSGSKAKRTDWGYSDDSYIVIHKMRGVEQFYMTNANNTESDIIGYGITHLDLMSNNWVIVE